MFKSYNPKKLGVFVFFELVSFKIMQSAMQAEKQKKNRTKMNENNYPEESHGQMGYKFPPQNAENTIYFANLIKPTFYKPPLHLPLFFPRRKGKHNFEFFVSVFDNCKDL